MIAKSYAEHFMGPNVKDGFMVAFQMGMMAALRLTLPVGDKKCPVCGGEVRSFPGGIVCSTDGCGAALTVPQGEANLGDPVSVVIDDRQRRFVPHAVQLEPLTENATDPEDLITFPVQPEPQPNFEPENDDEPEDSR